MARKLEKYKAKRDFNKTSEPQGKEGEKEKSYLKFVVQHHIATRDHYDFRLEWKGVLLSWAIPKGPSFNPKDKRLAIQVEDHPLDYRNFEGTIPKGQYGGGTVMLWDEGEWEPLINFTQGLKKGELKFALSGKRLVGKWSLIEIASDKKVKNSWILIKEKDEYAKNEDISKFNTSIKTGRTMSEIEKGEDKKIIKNPFKKIEVQLAKLVDYIPREDNWIYEIKYDGYRMVAFIEDNTAKLITRNGQNFTSRFKSIEKSLINFSKSKAMVLDGEIVVIDERGKTDFQLLQNNFKSSEPTYIVFDLLALDGKDLRKEPLIKRKKLLSNLLKDAPKNIYYSAHIKDKGKEAFEGACKMGMEGIIGKREDSTYNGKRNGDWIKLKCDHRQEFIIGGYTRTNKREKGVSAILLGVYEKNKLIFVGASGTGMTEKMKNDFEQEFQKIKQEKCPFINTPTIKRNEKVFYLNPKIVAEIKFAGWTKENLLRQASFKGLRYDKNPKDIVIEKSDSKNKKKDMPKLKEIKNKEGEVINIGGVKITNAEKIMFKNLAIKKIDIVRYYIKMAKRMLPYLQKRIISVIRCPKGELGPCFFKKHPDVINKGVVPIKIKSNKNAKEEYFYIENIYGLISEVNMNSIEFHTWASNVDNLEKPDIMVFDLDPDEGMDLNQIRQGVRDLKSILDELSLTSFLKISGGKGYHVVVPLRPTKNWEIFSNFAKNIAKIMEQKWPNKYTSNSRKTNRKNKIFIDWERNGRGATSIAPYSVRIRKGAPVSMPISWKELDKIAPNEINIENAIKRLRRADPWKDFFKANKNFE